MTYIHCGGWPIELGVKISNRDFSGSYHHHFEQLSPVKFLLSGTFYIKLDYIMQIKKRVIQMINPDLRKIIHIFKECRQFKCAHESVLL